jgi:uridine phosphorylase
MIPASELIINPDGSIYHLHLRPEQLADNIILVGDPGRVPVVADFFDSKEFVITNREFIIITGSYNGKRMTVMSTGMGTDNIDIVLTELDALANVNFKTREINPVHRTLNMVRIGTSGSMQDHITIGSYVLSEISVGFDNTLNYYAGREGISLHDFEDAFMAHMQWTPRLAFPYFVKSSKKLNTLFKEFCVEGMTISSPGFFGPQGRIVRLPLADPDMNAKVTAFKHKDKVITNYEMESSALAGLGRLLGHEATTVCYIIANRIQQTTDSNYKTGHQANNSMNDLIQKVLDKLASLES